MTQNKQRMTHQQEMELNDYMREENDFFINSEQNKQNEIMKKQDEQLDILHDNIKTVHQIGIKINEEIDQQDDILNEMSDKVDSTDTRILSSRKKIDEIIEKSSNWKIGSFICCLVVILIVIIILIFVL